MPSIASAKLPKWERPSETNEKLDWAEIKVIDLARFDEPGEKQRLAEDLRDAVCNALYYL
jgi:gibberellin 2-oxidase